MGVDVEQLLTTSAGWRELLGRLRHDQERIAERVLTRLFELPSYRAVPVDELRPSVVASIRALIDALHIGASDRPTGSSPNQQNGQHHQNGQQQNGQHQNGQPQNGHEAAAANGHPGRAGERRAGRAESRESFLLLGELRARQGVTAGDLVHGWHAATEEVVRRAREVLSAGPETDRLLLQLYAQVFRRLDGTMVASTEGHHIAEVERARRDQHARTNLLRALFSDRLTPAALHRRAELFRLDRTARYHAVRARPRTAAESAAVEAYLGGVTSGAVETPGRPRQGVVALVDDDVWGILERLPAEPAPCAVGVSPAVGLPELPAAFRSATRLLEVAVSLGRTGLVDLGTVGVEAAVVSDDEVGEAMVARYVLPLESLGPAGELVLDTVARYLANDGRLDTTARELHVHVNTVRYRLGRFEQVTSSSLRSYETLVQVWWAMRRRAMRAGQVPR